MPQLKDYILIANIEACKLADARKWPPRIVLPGCEKEQLDRLRQVLKDDACQELYFIYEQ